MVRVKRYDGSVIPQKGTSGSAGYDLCTPTAFSLAPNEQKTIDLKFALEIPDTMVGRIESRSSVATKKECEVVAGVIDPDYRGSICVVLRNYGTKVAEFAAGDKIAQILFLMCYTGDLLETEDLTPTVRDVNGFGSTDNPAKRTKLEE
jgi:dUTP pyrophosphatase